MGIRAGSSELVQLPPSPFVRRFGRLLGGITVPGLVVDLGCCTGRNSRYLAGLGHTVLGIDADTTAIEAARTLGQEAGLNSCRFEMGDIRRLKLGKQCLAFLANEVLHQLPTNEVGGLLAAAREATRPGGYHAVSDYLQAPDGSGEPAHYLRSGQLRAAYSSVGWEVLDYAEELPSQTLIDGQVVDNWQATIIARKPDC